MANKLYNKQVSPKGYQTGGRVAKMGGGMMMKRPMMNGSRTNMKIGGFLKKVGKKVGKAAAGVGAAVLAAKALKKKKPTGKKQDAVDKFFKKKGTTLKTGSAIAAETIGAITEPVSEVLVADQIGKSLVGRGIGIDLSKLLRPDEKGDVDIALQGAAIN